MSAIAADRHLLFGLLALQNGLIDQSQLMLALQAWTRDKTRSLADHLQARGDLTAAKRAILDALAEVHLEAHGDDVEKSLAAVPTDHATRTGLASLGEPEIDAALTRVTGGKHGQTTNVDDDPHRTLNLAAGESTGDGQRGRSSILAVGGSTGDGQRFHVLRPHARGGLGEVSVALDAELNREVALKQMLDSHANDPASRRRFVLEAEITGGLEHPGIVPVYGLGTYAAGRPYYAMRFIRGDSLKEAIETFHADEDLKRDTGRRVLELHKLLRRFVDICNAIDYAHARGVLHRDIKPGNVIVGRHGETLVVDWGLAKVTGLSDPSAGERTLMPDSAGSRSETLPGSVMGTPAYMSPEQSEGDLDRLGPRSDVYSLGATLYCLLTGRPPFEGNVIDVLRRVRQGDFPPPREHEPTLDRALEAVCLKAMTLKPEDRYPSAKALSEEVERWMADEPVSAWAEPLGRRLRRWGRRHRTGVTAGAVAVLLALAGSAAVLAVQTKANRNLTAANRRESQANVALRAAVERERAQFDLAMDAIRDSHERITDDILMKQAEFAGLRGKLLTSSRDFYQKLEASLAGKTDRRSRAALGQAFQALGELAQKTGATEEAVASLVRAVTTRRALAREEPADGRARSDLGHSLLTLGIARSDLTGQNGQATTDLGEASSELEAAAKERPDDPHLRLDLAKCLLAQGTVQSAAGPPQEGQSAIASGLDALKALVDEHPDDRDARIALGMALTISGTRARVGGRPAEALALFEQARAVLKRYAEAHPDDTEIQLELGATYNLAGIILGDELTKIDEARAAFQRYFDILAPVARANPGVLNFVIGLKTAHYNIGRMFWEEGRLDEALPNLQSVRDENEALARAHLDDVQFRYFRWIQNGHVGQVLEQMGRLPEALTAAGRSRAAAEETAAAMPSMVELKIWVASGNDDVGKVLQRMGRQAEAMQPLARAREAWDAYLAKNPDDPLARNAAVLNLARLAAARQHAGQPAEAAALFREAIARLDTRTDLKPFDIYLMACCRSLLSGLPMTPSSVLTAADLRGQAEAAVGLLRRAARAGHLIPGKLRVDSDLDPLRRRDDFRLLMMDLAFPAEPFAQTR